MQVGLDAAERHADDRVVQEREEQQRAQRGESKSPAAPMTAGARDGHLGPQFH